MHFCFGYLSERILHFDSLFIILQQLLFILSSEANSLQRYKIMNEKLFTQCTSFVLNRWDQIPANNAEQVKQK